MSSHLYGQNVFGEAPGSAANTAVRGMPPPPWLARPFVFHEDPAVEHGISPPTVAEATTTRTTTTMRSEMSLPFNDGYHSQTNALLFSLFHHRSPANGPGGIPVSRGGSEVGSTRSSTYSSSNPRNWNNATGSNSEALTCRTDKGGDDSSGTSVRPRPSSTSSLSTNPRGREDHASEDRRDTPTPTVKDDAHHQSGDETAATEQRSRRQTTRLALLPAPTPTLVDSNSKADKMVDEEEEQEEGLRGMSATTFSSASPALVMDKGIANTRWVDHRQMGMNRGGNKWVRAEPQEEEEDLATRTYPTHPSAEMPSGPRTRRHQTSLSSSSSLSSLAGGRDMSVEDTSDAASGHSEHVTAAPHQPTRQPPTMECSRGHDHAAVLFNVEKGSEELSPCEILIANSNDYAFPPPSAPLHYHQVTREAVEAQPAVYTYRRRARGNAASGMPPPPPTSPLEIPKTTSLTEWELSTRPAGPGVKKSVRKVERMDRRKDERGTRRRGTSHSSTDSAGPPLQPGERRRRWERRRNSSHAMMYESTPLGGVDPSSTTTTTTIISETNREAKNSSDVAQRSTALSISPIECREETWKMVKDSGRQGARENRQYFFDRRHSSFSPRNSPSSSSYGWRRGRGSPSTKIHVQSRTEGGRDEMPQSTASDDLAGSKPALTMTSMVSPSLHCEKDQEEEEEEAEGRRKVKRQPDVPSEFTPSRVPGHMADLAPALYQWSRKAPIKKSQRIRVGDVERNTKPPCAVEAITFESDEGRRPMLGLIDLVHSSGGEECGDRHHFRDFDDDGYDNEKGDSTPAIRINDQRVPPSTRALKRKAQHPTTENRMACMTLSENTTSALTMTTMTPTNITSSHVTPDRSHGKEIRGDTTSAHSHSQHGFPPVEEVVDGARKKATDLVAKTVKMAQEKEDKNEEEEEEKPVRYEKDMWQNESVEAAAPRNRGGSDRPRHSPASSAAHREWVAAYLLRRLQGGRATPSESQPPHHHHPIQKEEGEQEEADENRGEEDSCGRFVSLAPVDVFCDRRTPGNGKRTNKKNTLTAPTTADPPTPATSLWTATTTNTSYTEHDGDEDGFIRREKGNAQHCDLPPYTSDVWKTHSPPHFRLSQQDATDALLPHPTSSSLPPPSSSLPSEWQHTDTRLSSPSRPIPSYRTATAVVANTNTTTSHNSHSSSSSSSSSADIMTPIIRITSVPLEERQATHRAFYNPHAFLSVGAEAKSQKSHPSIELHRPEWFGTTNTAATSTSTTASSAVPKVGEMKAARRPSPLSIASCSCSNSDACTCSCCGEASFQSCGLKGAFDAERGNQGSSHQASSMRPMERPHADVRSVARDWSESSPRSPFSPPALNGVSMDVPVTRTAPLDRKEKEKKKRLQYSTWSGGSHTSSAGVGAQEGEGHIPLQRPPSHDSPRTPSFQGVKWSEEEEDDGNAPWWGGCDCSCHLEAPHNGGGGGVYAIVIPPSSTEGSSSSCRLCRCSCSESSVASSEERRRDRERRRRSAASTRRRKGSQRRKHRDHDRHRHRSIPSSGENEGEDNRTCIVPAAAARHDALPAPSATLRDPESAERAKEEQAEEERQRVAMIRMVVAQLQDTAHQLSWTAAWMPAFQRLTEEEATDRQRIRADAEMEWQPIAIAAATAAAHRRQEQQLDSLVKAAADSVSRIQDQAIAALASDRSSSSTHPKQQEGEGTPSRGAEASPGAPQREEMSSLNVAPHSPQQDMSITTFRKQGEKGNGGVGGRDEEGIEHVPSADSPPLAVTSTKSTVHRSTSPLLALVQTTRPPSPSPSEVEKAIQRVASAMLRVVLDEEDARRRLLASQEEMWAMAMGWSAALRQGAADRAELKATLSSTRVELTTAHEARESALWSRAIEALGAAEHQTRVGWEALEADARGRLCVACDSATDHLRRQRERYEAVVQRVTRERDRALEECRDREVKLRHALSLPTVILAPSPLEHMDAAFNDPERVREDFNLPVHRRFARAHQEALKATRAQKRCC